MRRFLRAALVITIGLSVSTAYTEPPRLIAGFGSSVCNGTGDHFGRGGYIGLLAERMETRGWKVVSVSRGGDNTVTIQDRWMKTGEPPRRPVAEDRYLLPHHAGYVVVGLSLANEGIRMDDPAERERVFEQFRTGLLGIIERCRREGMRAVVANCYPHSDYQPEHYEAVKRMNLLINTWDVPSINLLGSIDDGAGRWVRGFYRDAGHPSGSGHEEMFHAIVPSLFEALEKGKPPPKQCNQPGGAMVEDTKDAAFVMGVDDEIHSFAVSFRVRIQGDGTLADAAGHFGAIESGRYEYNGERIGSRQVVGISRAVTATIHVRNDRIAYVASTGEEILGTRDVTDDEWHDLTLSHRCAQGETRLFADGELVGAVEERVLPSRFRLGVSGAASYRDWYVHRSSLNEDEVRALHNRKMIQSSLELYAPLRDPQFTEGFFLKNRAQSLSQAVVGAGSIVSLPD